MKPINHAILGLAAILLALSLASATQAQTLPADLVPIAASDIPRLGPTYYSIQKLSLWPPLPFNWLSDPNIVLYVSPSLGINAIFVGDLDDDYARQAAEAQVLRLASRAAANDAPSAPGGDSGTGGYGSGSDWSGGPWAYGANDF